MENDRPPLSCPDCRQPYRISQIFTGMSAVRPRSWFQIHEEHWEASCDCKVDDGTQLKLIRRPTEWELYRALGIGVA